MRRLTVLAYTAAAFSILAVAVISPLMHFHS
jgi:hypothetical protein